MSENRAHRSNLEQYYNLLKIKQYYNIIMFIDRKALMTELFIINWYNEKRKKSYMQLIVIND